MSGTPDTGDKGAQAVKQALLRIRELQARIAELETVAATPVAIVGAGLRLPGGVSDLASLSDLLDAGTNTAREIPVDRWDVEAWYHPERGRAGHLYARRASFVDGIDRFDPAFFGISGREAEAMDPQQRLLLECAWEAFEHAGIDPIRHAGSRTGVFVGQMNHDYAELATGSGTSASVASGRIAYAFGFTGPALTLDTACSSGLVALHLAAKAMARGECGMALVASANLQITPTMTVAECEGRMLSADGLCKTFDASADGYARSDGVIALLIKPLAAAQADGDPILGVLRGSGVSHGGASGGLLVPNGAAQQAAMRAALDDAGIDPCAIDYIEAHGTGTALGDPIELNAIEAVFGPDRDRPLPVGSVKTNFGHLEPASGLAGIVKVLAAFAGERLPRHLNCTTPNPLFDWSSSTIEITHEGRSWPRCEAARLAGVSAFGVAGTNAHVILEEPPLQAPNEAGASTRREVHLFKLSARSEQALSDLGRSLADAIEDLEAAPLGDIAATLGRGRSDFAFRRTILAGDAPTLVAALREGAGHDASSPVSESPERRPLVFLYPGQGAQYRGMGRSLYATEAVFRDTIDRCAEVMGESDVPLLDLLWGDAGEALHETRYTQPAIFAIELALTALWRSWGIRPDAVLGHSVGEYAAAVAAGIMAEDDAMRLVAARGRLLWDRCERGGMIAAMIAADAIDPATIDDRIDIAGHNAPGRTVFAGPDDALARLGEALDRHGVHWRALDVSHAFHSHMMEPARDEFAELCDAVAYSRPSVPIFANLTGAMEPGDTMARPGYWIEQMRAPVRFAQCVGAAETLTPGCYLEVGPNTHLAALARLTAGPQPGWVASLRPGMDEDEGIRRAAGALYGHGIVPDWRVLAPGEICALPTYPFERQRYWVGHPDDPPAEPATGTALSGCYRVEWKTLDWVGGEASDGEEIVLVGDRTTIGVSDEDAPASIVLRSDRDWPDTFDDALASLGGERSVLVVFAPDCEGDDPVATARTVAADFLALTRLAKRHGDCRIALVTRGGTAPGTDQPVGRVDTMMLGGMLGGMLRSMRLELPGGMASAHVDIAEGSTLADPPVLARVLAAIRSSDGETVIALRDGNAFTERLEPATAALDAGPVDATAAWLIVGGSGAIGLGLAASIVDAGARHLVLASRRGSTEAVEGAARTFRDQGVSVDIVALDMLDPDAVDRLFDRFGQDWPELGGTVFAAGLSGHAKLEDLDADAFEAVAIDRIAGMWNIHRSSLRHPTAQFILAGSIAGVWGGSGNIHYGAANAACDQLARARAALGYPAISIDWGPWAQSGVAVDAQAELARIGLIAMPPSRAARLALAMVGAGPQVVVADIDWPVFLPLMRIAGTPSVLRDMEPAQAVEETLPSGGSETERLTRLAAADRRQTLAERIEAALRSVLRIHDDVALRHAVPFVELGLDSLTAVDLVRALSGIVGRTLPVTLTFDYPTIAQLADHLAGTIVTPRSVSPPNGSPARDVPIAVVGMALRLPGGIDTAPAFWDALENRHVAIVDQPAGRWDVDDRDGASFALGALDDIRGFDAAFFGISRREAMTMDPQQRIALETAWHALENAGEAPGDQDGQRTGVYFGVGTNDYAQVLREDREFERDAAHLPTGNALSVIAGRISYSLGLGGPAMAIDTACSSSLVALMRAVDDLRLGRCERALAGGVNLAVTPDSFVMLSRAGMISPSGRCRAFDAEADGYVRGEGCVVLALKRLPDAEAQGDRILGVIQGGAINQDGRTASLTAPSGPAQQAVITDALRAAGIGADMVGYVEAHGTGTPLGDPIEIGALDATYGAERSEDAPLYVGAVKANLGHLEAAAGLAGVAKTMLCRMRGTIPAQPAFACLNPSIEGISDTIAVAADRADWPADAPFAGVSSFGFSGTNAHVILGPAPERTMRQRPHDGRARLVVLSGRDLAGLARLAGAVAEELGDGEDLTDISFTTLTARARQPLRLALVVADTADLRAALRIFASAPDRGSVAGGYVGEAGRDRPIDLSCDGVGIATLHGLVDTLAQDSATLRTILADADPAAMDCHALGAAISDFLRAMGFILSDTAGSTTRVSLADHIDVESGDDPRTGFLRMIAQMCTHADRPDLARLIDGAGARKVELAAYPFDRRDYWPESARRLRVHRARRSGQAPARLPGRRSQSPFGDAVMFVAELDPDRMTHLRDHRIFDRVLVAGASHLASALGALKATHGDGPVALEEVFFHRPLVIERDARLLRTALGKQEGDGARDVQTASLVSDAASDEEWTVHLTARSGIAPEHPLIEAVDPAALGTQWSQALDAATLYDRMDALGYNLGPSFQWLGAGRRKGSRVVRNIVTPAQPPEPFENYSLYPGLIDSCLHAIGECLEGRNDRVDEDQIYIPFALERVTLWRSPVAGEALWCHARLRDELGTAGVPLGDVVLIDDAGRAVAEFAGFDSRRTSRDALAPPAEGRPEVTAFETAWDAVSDDSGSGADTRCLVLCDNDTAATAILDTLERAGRVWRTLDPRNDDLEDALDGLDRTARAAGDGSLPDRILVLLDLELGDESDTATAIDACDRLRKALVATRRCWPRVPLRVVTRDADILPIQAARAAFVRAALLEDSERAISLLDLGGDARPEARDLLAPYVDAGAVIRLSEGGDGRSTAKAMRLRPCAASANTMPRLDPERCHVIVGGTGALGQELAAWCLERGARRLALVARRDRAPDHPDIVAASRAGARVDVVCADATDPRALGEAFDAIARELGPIGGIVHAAGTVEDGLLARQNRDGIARVMNGKAGVIDALESVLAQRDAPQFLLLLGSLSGITGLPAQSNYAATNAYCDTVTRRLRRSGLAAASLCLGPVAGPGMAAKLEARGGFAMLSREDLHGATDRIVAALAAGEEPPFELAVRADWNGVAQALPPMAPMLGALVSHEERSNEVRVSLAEIRAGQGEDGLRDWARYFIRGAVADALRMPVEQLSTDLALPALGFDSLMSIELRRAVEAEAGLDLPLAWLMAEHSTDHLVHLVADLAIQSGPMPTSLQSELVEIDL